MSEAVDTVVLESYLKKLYLSSFIRNHEAFASEAAQNNQSYTRYLLTLAEQEVQEREARRRQRRLKEAKIPVLKELSDFDFELVPQLNQNKIRQLVQGDYIDKAEPIILVGNPGLGKTHIATALAIEATRQMRRVRFYNAAALVNELLKAEEEGRVASFINKALNHHLFILDELGFIPFSSTGAQLMFQLVSALYERVAMIVTTNLKFADWTQVFGDERLTVALLDRLTHKAHIVEFHKIHKIVNQSRTQSMHTWRSPATPSTVPRSRSWRCARAQLTIAASLRTQITPVFTTTSSDAG